MNDNTSLEFDLTDEQTPLLVDTTGGGGGTSSNYVIIISLISLSAFSRKLFLLSF
jgi:hypothetical protein